MMTEPKGDGPDPTLFPALARITRNQKLGALVFLALIIAAVALIVTLSGKGGDSIKTNPAPAATPTPTELTTSRAAP